MLVPLTIATVFSMAGPSKGDIAQNAASSPAAAETAKRHAAACLFGSPYFFAAQPQRFPQLHDSLQRHGAAHVHRAASLPHPQSVV
jgi:hypothetical protein